MAKGKKRQPTPVREKDSACQNSASKPSGKGRTMGRAKLLYAAFCLLAAIALWGAQPTYSLICLVAAVVFVILSGVFKGRGKD